MIGVIYIMQKSNAIIKVDTEENWNKAINYVPDIFTVIVYQYPDKPPRIKLGDGINKVKDLPFLDKPNYITEDTLVL